jgi:hypothetical protein
MMAGPPLCEAPPLVATGTLADPSTDTSMPTETGVGTSIHFQAAGQSVAVVQVVAFG